MRKIRSLFLLLLSYCLSFSSLKAQDIPHDCGENPNLEELQLTGDFCNSHYGANHTPKGNLHVLFVFVTFRYTADPTFSNWSEHDLPEWASTPTMSDNKVVNSTVGAIGSVDNLSKWYKEMSNGAFILTGDVIHVEIDSIERDSTGVELIGNTNAKVMAELATYPIDWSKYDKRKNNPLWQSDNSNSSPDGIIDYLVISYRRLGNGWSGLSKLAGIDKYVVSPGFEVDYYSGHYADWVNDSKYHHEKYFLHEFAHNLYHAEHYFGANQTVGNKFYCNTGWGMMSNLHPVWHTTNAWEEWWLGWLTPQTTSMGVNKTFYLSDFITQNDAIRVPIPNTNEYLWIENHRKLHPMDQKIAYSEISPAVAGVYMYVTSGGHNDCSKPNLNSASNALKVISAEGNKDYVHSGTVNGYMNFNTVALNKFSGENELVYIRKNFRPEDPEKILLYTNALGAPETDYNEHMNVWSKNGAYTCSYVGDAGDVFQVGDEASLSANAVITNYPDYTRNVKIGTPTYFINELNNIYLNGMRVRIVALNNDIYEIEVRYDDFEVRNDSRWTGLLELRNSSGDNSPDILLKTGKTINVNKSGTVNTNYPFHYNNPPVITYGLIMLPDFILPTSLKVKNQAFIRLEPSSTFIIEEGSTVDMSESSKIEVDEATLWIRSGGKLIIGDNSSLIVKGTGKVIIENGGRLVIKQSGLIYLNNSTSVIEIGDQGKLAIGKNAVFSVNGDGHLKFLDVSGTPNIVKNEEIVFTTGVGWYWEKASNTSFILQGTGFLPYDDPIAKVGPGAAMYFEDNISFAKLERGNIEMGEAARIISACSLSLNQLKLWATSPLQKHNGITVFGQSFVGVTSVLIIDGDRGFSSYNYYKGHDLRIGSIEAQNCNIGVYVQGKGVKIDYANLHHNKTGLWLDGVDRTCLISNLNAYQNRAGVDLSGTMTNLVHFDKPQIYNNSVGVFSVNSAFSASCGMIANNKYVSGAGFAGQNVFLKDNSYMVLDPSMKTGAGNMEMNNSGAGSIEFYNGYLAFLKNANSNLLTTNSKAITGYLRPFYGPGEPNPSPLNASGNYWIAGGGAPLAGTNYQVNYTYSFSPQLLTINDASPLSSQPSHSACNTPPAGGVGTGSTIFAAVGPDIMMPNSMKSTIVNGINALYAEDYQTAVDNFHAVLTYNFTAAQFETWSLPIRYSYDRMLEALGSGISEGNIEVGDAPDFSDHVAKVLEVQEILLQQYENEYALKFKISLDKALLYRLCESRDEAITQLTDLQAWTDADFSGLVEYYLCLTTREQQVINGDISVTDYYEPGDCGGMRGLPETEDPYVWEEGSEQPFMSVDENQKQSRLLVYPNPAQDLVYLELPGLKGNLKLEVLDITGRVLFTQSVSETKLTLNTVSLQNGSYFIRVSGAGVSEVKKIVVLR